MLVKDYKGDLIEKSKARRIKNELGDAQYYEMGVSCIKMEDEKWYRITTGKILFDHSLSKWVFAESFIGSTGLVGDGTIGKYSDISSEITVFAKSKVKSTKVTTNLDTGLTEQIPI